MECNKPLQYKISSWKQLSRCKSNNDKDLLITVTDFKNNDFIQGTRIEVYHPRFGALFSETIDAKGSFITNLDEPHSTLSFELSADVILKELRKYGFFIMYNPREHLPESLVEYLITLKGLGFDKLRILHVKDKFHKKYNWYVVGFYSSKHPEWLDNTYVSTSDEFTCALLDGSAMNVSELCTSKGYNWLWLDYVANIDDILKDNIKRWDNGG